MRNPKVLNEHVQLTSGFQQNKNRVRLDNPPTHYSSCPTGNRFSSTR
jgi:hypothetical protein